MNVMGELALIFGISLVGEGVAALLPMAFPASVISMVLLMVLLLTGVLKEQQIQSVSHFLIANMAFIFHPVPGGHHGARGDAEKSGGAHSGHCRADHAGGLSGHRLDGAADDAAAPRKGGEAPWLNGWTDF